MSSRKRNFQCFNAVGGEGSHKHHTSQLPRIPQHGMVAHQETPEECYICSEYRHAQALEELETQAASLYPSHAPYHYHHPNEYVLRRPARPEEHPMAHSGHNRHIQHRYNKRVVLVKNSDPSLRKTIILHRRSLRNFELFLEEVSELMQYRIRKLYTLEGRKIDNIQSLIQCPSVLVCVGREPSHPSIVENFRKTSDDKLPKISMRSHSSGRNEGHEGLPTKTSVISSKLETDTRSARQSVSSDKSLPDGMDSPDIVDSCPHSGDGMRHDDIEKRVCVNKDGSLSMEMKVRFRLQNDETLHWSTKVRKTTGKTGDYLQEHNNPYFAQVNDRSYSENENISASEQDEAYISRHHQRHTEEPHCPHCCQEYDNWKNIPGTHGASQCVQTSSSSGSSHRVVSRKTMVERQTVSRSSEEHTEQVVERETRVKQTVEAAETVEYCIIRSETCSPKCKVKSPTVDNSEVGVDSPLNDQVNVETAQTTEQEEQTGSAPSASSGVLTDHEEAQNDDEKDVPLNASSAMLETGSPVQHSFTNPTDRASNATGSSRKSRSHKSKKTYICNCTVSNDPEAQAEEEGDMQGEDEEVATAENENAVDTTEHKSEQESDKEEAVAAIEDVEETAAASDDDFAESLDANTAEENDATGDELSKDPAHEATTEDELVVEREIAVTSEDELEEEPAETTIAEDENAEEATIAATECEFNKGADDSADATADGSSKEPAEEAETEDEIAEKEITSEDQSKEKTVEDEIVAEETDVAATTENESEEEAVEARIADDGEEETAATSDDNSAEEATANEEENDATCDESKEPAEAATTEDESGTEKETDAISKAESMEELAEDAKDETTAGESDVAATTEEEPEDEAAEAEMTEDGEQPVDEDAVEDESAVEKDAAVTSEDEAEDAAEEADVVATSENESDKDEAVEATTAN
ncbi:Retinitis pigmentosa 1-like 1 protein, partial [Nibea albiflora]